MAITKTRNILFPALAAMILLLIFPLALADIGVNQQPQGFSSGHHPYFTYQDIFDITITEVNTQSFQADITVNTPSTPTNPTFIYEKGYYVKNSQWAPFTFDDQTYQGSTWILQTASKTITENYADFPSSADFDEFVAIMYYCTLITENGASEWRCGCTDDTGSECNLWSIESANVELNQGLPPPPPAFCGDGQCNGQETEITCWHDCQGQGPTCGNSICEQGEDSSNCPSDCQPQGPTCGNNVCEAGEDHTTCPNDCQAPGPVCGNNVCEQGEDSSSCPSDCQPQGSGNLPIEYDFEQSLDGFIYSTQSNYPTQSVGQRIDAASLCQDAFCLEISLNENMPLEAGPFSGAWKNQFTLTQATDLQLNFWYQLTLGEPTEEGEIATLKLKHPLSNQYITVASLEHDNPGTNTVQAQTYTNVFSLPAGTYDLEVMCELTQVSRDDEFANCLLDDFSLSVFDGGAFCGDGMCDQGEDSLTCSADCGSPNPFEFSVEVTEKDNSHPYFGVGSTHGFTVDGVQGKELTLIRGQTYEFNVNVPTSHPFYISTDSVGQSAGVYSQDVTGNFVTNGVLTFTPDTQTPDTLYYQCNNHANMGWKLNIVDDGMCGDGTVNVAEECDDGNTITEMCSYGYTQCTVCTSSCEFGQGQTHYCGDGVLQSNFGEQCDDGNNNNGDGCSSACLDENNPAPSGDFIETVQSGEWTSPSTWNENRVPSQGDDVRINTGHTVVYNQYSSQDIRFVHIKGKLEFSRAQDTLLSAGAIVISSADAIDLDSTCSNHHVGHGGHNHGGMSPTLEVGTIDNPIPANVNAKIQLAYFSDMDSNCQPGIIAHDGVFDVHGAKVTSWLRLAQTANPGDTQLVLESAPIGWKTGDTVVISGVRGKKDLEFGEDRFPNIEDVPASVHQTEERQIQSVSGNTVTLSSSVSYEHYGPNVLGGPHPGVEVALLHRNVVITSKDPNGVRGHTMWHHGGDGGLSNAEFSYLGKGGVLARYPIHMHLTGQSLRGLQIESVSVHNSNNRCITVHGTNYAFIKDNFGYKAKGHCYFLEDGSEINNYFVNNFALQTFQADELPNQAIEWDSNDGAGFWGVNGYNAFEENSVSQTGLYGFQFEMDGDGFTTLMQQEDGSLQLTEVDKLPFMKFKDNVIHSQLKYGISIEEDFLADPNNPSVIEDLTIFYTWYCGSLQATNMYVKGLTMVNCAYGHYVHEQGPARYVDFYSKDVGNYHISGGADAARGGIMTFENVLTLGDGGDGARINLKDAPVTPHEIHIKDYDFATPDGDDTFKFARAINSGGKTSPETVLYLHDYFPTAPRDAKVIASEYNPNDGLTYDTNPGSDFENGLKVARVDVDFPVEIELVDTSRPATAITYPQENGHVHTSSGTLTVRGFTIDQSDIANVYVNGQQATFDEGASGQWSVTLTGVSSGMLTVTAYAQDVHGNTEINPHEIMVHIN